MTTSQASTLLDSVVVILIVAGLIFVAVTTHGTSQAQTACIARGGVFFVASGENLCLDPTVLR